MYGKVPNMPHWRAWWMILEGSTICFSRVDGKELYPNSDYWPMYSGLSDDEIDELIAKHVPEMEEFDKTNPYDINLKWPIIVPMNIEGL